MPLYNSSTASTEYLLDSDKLTTTWLGFHSWRRYLKWKKQWLYSQMLQGAIHQVDKALYHGVYG